MPPFLTQIRPEFAQPPKKWYELALESIEETATTIGEVEKPILDTVKTLAPLLAALA